MNSLNRIIIFIVLFLSGSSICRAQKFSLGDTVDNAFIKKERGTFTHFLQSQIVNLKDTDDFVYCIDPFDRISTIADYDEHDSNFGWYSKLDDDTWDKIVAAAALGYKYKNHNDPIWYSVTQVVIWRTVAKDASINFTDTFNGNIIHDYDDMIDELEDLIDEYYDTSEIPKKVTLNYDEYESYDLNDNYNVLEDDDSVTMGKKRLKIRPNYIGSNDYTIYKGDKDNTMLYTHDSYQNLIYVYDMPYVEKEITVKSIGGKININLDYENKYNNTCESSSTTKYGLYDSNDKLIMELDKSKVSSYLTYGKYYVKQISVGCNYLYDSNKYEINLDKEEVTKKINVYQKVKKVHLHHNICVNDECVKEGNVTFKIIDLNGNEVTGITDEDGNFDIELSNTKYIINQIDGNDLYTYTNEFVLDLCEYVEDDIDITLNGYLYKADIKVIVKDDNGNLIDDAKVCLYNDELIECVNTINGEVVFKNMIFGKYKVIEEDVPKRYILNNSVNKIELTKNIIIKIVNKEIIGNDIKISYKDSTDNDKRDVDNNIENPETGDINIWLFSYISGICVFFLKILIKLL